MRKMQHQIESAEQHCMLPQHIVWLQLQWCPCTVRLYSADLLTNKLGANRYGKNKSNVSRFAWIPLALVVTSKYITSSFRPVNRRGFVPPAKIFASHEKCVGHSLKNLGPFQETLRPTWSPKLVTGLLSLPRAIQSKVSQLCKSVLKDLTLAVHLLRRKGSNADPKGQSWASFFGINLLVSDKTEYGWKASDGARLLLPVSRYLRVE